MNNLKKIVIVVSLVGFVVLPVLALAQSTTATSAGIAQSPTTQPILNQSNCTVNGQSVPCAKIGGFLGLGLGIILFLLVISVLAFIFWLFMLIHAIKNPIVDKAVWIIILILFGILGAIIYYFAVKRSFDKQQQRPLVAPAQNTSNGQQ
jgi:Phospholipase_D-nuclease N-terminal